MNRVYLVQIAYKTQDNCGVSYNTIEAKNKKQAIKQCLAKEFGESQCALISIKRCSRELAEVVAEHNRKVKGEENE